MNCQGPAPAFAGKRLLSQHNPGPQAAGRSIFEGKLKHTRFVDKFQKFLRIRYSRVSNAWVWNKHVRHKREKIIVKPPIHSSLRHAAIFRSVTAHLLVTRVKEVPVVVVH